MTQELPEDSNSISMSEKKRKTANSSNLLIHQRCASPGKKQKHFSCNLQYVLIERSLKITKVSSSRIILGQKVPSPRERSMPQQSPQGNYS